MSDIQDAEDTNKCVVMIVGDHKFQTLIDNIETACETLDILSL